MKKFYNKKKKNLNFKPYHKIFILISLFIILFKKISKSKILNIYI